MFPMKLPGFLIGNAGQKTERLRNLEKKRKKLKSRIFILKMNKMRNLLCCIAVAASVFTPGEVAI